MQVKDEKSCPNLQNLIKNKSRETFSNMHQKGTTRDNTKKSNSTFLKDSYNNKKNLKHCSSLCYFNPFGLHIIFQSS